MSNEKILYRNSTLVSQDSDKTGLLLAVSLANSNCLTYSEEYIIQDQYCGIELIEKRIPSLQNIASQVKYKIRRHFSDVFLLVRSAAKELNVILATSMLAYYGPSKKMPPYQKSAESINKCD